MMIKRRIKRQDPQATLASLDAITASLIAQTAQTLGSAK